MIGRLAALLGISLAFEMCTTNQIGSVLVAQEAANQENPYAIDLANRTLMPEEGVDRSLLDAIEEAGSRPVPGVIQLWGVPTREERRRLAESGARLLEYLGGTAYLARFSSEASLDAQRALIRWAGPLLSEDKVESDLWKGTISEWAHGENDSIKLLVSFFDDVETTEAERLISRYTRMYTRHGPSNDWALELPHAAIGKLASSPCVKWIQQGPLPMMPLE